jgi:hypothetical protein
MYHALFPEGQSKVNGHKDDVIVVRAQFGLGIILKHPSNGIAGNNIALLLTDLYRR